ncbi:MAG: hypothetical protein KDE22_00160, partial [Rhodobacterales bacterium]|nr:hypothetical protein [Rhodobacterales bacterium]
NVCDVAIANSYYMPIMLSRDDQRAWGQSARVVFPDQDGKGSYVLTSGVALTKADRAVDAATKFVEFLVSNYGQTAITNTTYEFPVIGGVALPEPLMALGKEEAGVSAATFKSNFVPLGKIEDQRAKVTAILDEINFDQK